MRILTGRLVGAMALCAALSAQGGVRAELHAPRAGEVLRGGTRATIAWTIACSAPALPAFVEEWEAFLSVDGGTYYAYRITPHLDDDRRNFTFEVPNVETTNARILIRAGNERREIEIETSQTFIIERDEARALATPSQGIIEERRGESAREGDLGVVQWIDGDRDGEHLVERTAFGDESLVAATVVVETDSWCGEAADGGPVFKPRGVPAGLARTTPHMLPRLALRHRSGRDVLLGYRRLNL